MRDNLKEQLTHYGGNAIDICARIYNESFVNNPNKDNVVLLLKELCEQWGFVNSDQSIIVEESYSQEEYNDAIKKVKPTVDIILDNLAMKVLSEEAFYTEILQNLNNDTLFAQPVDKICALYIVLNSTKVPYYALPLIPKMSDEDFTRYRDTVSQLFRKAYFIINRGYTQFTQVSEQLLEVLDEVKVKEQRTVLMSMILATFLSPREKEESEESSEE